MKKYFNFINEALNKMMTTDDLILNDYDIDVYILENHDFSDYYYYYLSFEEVEDYIDETSFNDFMGENYIENCFLSKFETSDKREFIEENYLESIVEDYWVNFNENEEYDTGDFDTKLDYLEDEYDNIIEDYSDTLFFEYMFEKKHYDGIAYYNDSNLSIDDILDYIDLDEVNEHVLLKKLKKKEKRIEYIDYVIDNDDEAINIIEYNNKNILYFYGDDFEYNVFEKTKYQDILITEYTKQFKNTRIENLLIEMSEEFELTDDIKKKYSKYLKMHKFNL